MMNTRRKTDVLRYKFAKKNIYLVNRRMTLPTGMKVKLDVILHPGAVLIVPFLTRDKLVLLRQFRPALNRFHFEFPAGTLEPKELPQACAHRELMEEAGYYPKKLTRVGEI